MKNISKYFFILILAISPGVKAQEAETLVFRQNVSLGYDVSGFARKLIEPEVFMHGISAGFEWRPNWTASLELGTLGIDVQRDSHQYLASGFFVRSGVNYNLLQKTSMPGEELFVSFRYGFGSLAHEAPNISIIDPYWGSLETSLDPARYSAHWAEIGGGLKTRLFWNIYIGWDLRIRLKLARSSDIEMEPYYISGFGKGKNNSVVMLHYSVYYKFPFGK